MTQTPKVEKSPFELFVEAEIAKNGREPHWPRRCLELHQRAEFLSDEDEHLRARIEALETALKASIAYIEHDHDSSDDLCAAYKSYQDALAKVDVKWE